ncbi:MAG: hypothetical protein V4592_22960 [Bacteroidota bacterium]
MNMQDNEMDQLFRAKLDSYEVEPSAKVWANISDELGGGKQRKSIVPMLRIAASVVVVISAGLFFLVKKQVNVEQPASGKKLAGVVIPVVKPTGSVQPGSINQTVNTVPQIQPAVNVQPKQGLAAVVRNNTAQQQAGATRPATTNTVQVPVTNTVQTQAPITPPQTLIAAIDPPKASDAHAMPDGPIAIPTNAIAGDNSKGNELALATTPADEDNKPTQAKKRKATGLGGFLNKVIAAVDKRDDKIIEFTDTDEGDAITGINLGILKVKKQK